ncbi:hypothetical protein [Elizabethkingia miricola]|uniref:hypothetical protein n=1 Tax=Elizabethkingia miricola TaxID=172045 RepID=UPI0009999007|nr:hypothetical protein [Elizabethkingia miricola]OPC06813.1 hypothetical protein BAY01_18495 [Elizabethkingia miricola]
MSNNDFRLEDFNSNNDIKSEVATKNYILRMYFDDYEKLIKFRNYKMLKEHNMDYNLSKAISEGIGLLEKRYPDIERGMEKTNFKNGRRSKKNRLDDIEIKDSSAHLSREDTNFLNDFIYHKIYKEENLEYTRMELAHEIISALEKQYKGKF